MPFISFCRVIEDLLLGCELIASVINTATSAQRLALHRLAAELSVNLHFIREVTTAN
jgi:hypothetical protein